MRWYRRATSSWRPAEVGENVVDSGSVSFFRFTADFGSGFGSDVIVLGARLDDHLEDVALTAEQCPRQPVYI
jgi:hypothetical protein